MTEFTAIKTKQFFFDANIDHISVQKSMPTQNGFIERFNRSYREGVLDAFDAFILSSINQAREETTTWMEDYINNHLHKSHGGKPLLEYG